ncbi:MAG TPA: nucleotide exchange factor GrpE [Buchnera sp. (in: enterobacteria)]|nr:nucleotide exchange factor GrpE [Buchnera sp. (in: enterobacteria)]
MTLDEKKLQDDSISFEKKLEEKELTEEYLFLKDSFLKNKKKSEKKIEQIKKITEKEIENSYSSSFDEIIKPILISIDNLERALILSEENKENLVILNLKDILKNFQEFLFQFNISTIDPKNEKFNPDKHQAIAIVQSKKIKSNYISEVIQKGYKINNRLLRPAMVTVSSNSND